MKRAEKKFNGGNNLSLRVKITASIAIVFLLIMGVRTTIALVSEQGRIEELTKHSVVNEASNFFDSLNMLMLTGNMDERKTLLEKVRRSDGILDARVIRGEPVKQQFGPGLASEQA